MSIVSRRCFLVLMHLRLIVACPVDLAAASWKLEDDASLPRSASIAMSHRTAFVLY